MKKMFFIILILLSFFTSCEESSSCFSETLSFDDGSITSLRNEAESDFNCSQMEKYFDLDADKVVKRFIGGTFTFKEAYFTKTEGALTVDEYPIENLKLPQTIEIGSLKSCSFTELPEAIRCNGSFTLAFYTSFDATITFMFGTSSDRTVDSTLTPSKSDFFIKTNDNAVFNDGYDPNYNELLFVNHTDEGTENYIYKYKWPIE